MSLGFGFLGVFAMEMSDDLMIELLTNPMRGVRIKIERSQKHLYELHREVSAFWRRNPYEIVPDRKLNEVEMVYKLRIRETIPPYWAGIIGDIVHNLRSALDLLANTLVANAGDKTGTRPGDHTKWPVASTQEELRRSRLRSGLKGASEAVIDFVDKTPSYETGGLSIWNLHQLDIADKHVALVPVSYMPTFVQPGLSPEYAYDPKNGLLNAPDGIDVGIFPIFVGKRRYHPDFAFGIAFGQGEVLRGHLVLPTLDKFLHLVAGISAIAAQEFFKMELDLKSW
jgi:hypothetical protein